MATKHYCDSCKSEIEGYTISGHHVTFPEESYDLCKECMEKVLALIETGKVY